MNFYQFVSIVQSSKDALLNLSEFGMKKISITTEILFQYYNQIARQS